MPSNNIKVFEVNDCEWWAGACTPQELLAVYMHDTGCTHEDATGDLSVYPRELTEPEMLKLKFRLEDENSGTVLTRTFREHLDVLIAEGTQFPCFFATTEW